MPEIPDIMLKPKSPNVKYSGAPNFRANFAKKGDAHINIIQLIIPPVKDAKVDINKAFPPSPLFVIG